MFSLMVNSLMIGNRNKNMWMMIGMKDIEAWNLSWKRDEKGAESEPRDENNNDWDWERNLRRD
jgi:hypothetical protein